ncbi:MAG: hypothetical protein EA392_12550 [Cryomorphaceae bacterium]|nr:MAG: hypothetical protein EA392_12550 [Cryomorphaceae bacterium]
MKSKAIKLVLVLFAFVLFCCDFMENSNQPNKIEVLDSYPSDIDSIVLFSLQEEYGEDIEIETAVLHPLVKKHQNQGMGGNEAKRDTSMYIARVKVLLIDAKESESWVFSFDENIHLQWAIKEDASSGVELEQ